MDDSKSLTQITQAAEVIKTAILQSQERTIKNANTDVLSLNYAVGGYISQQSKQHQWGSGIIRAISEKLQRDMPGLRGFGYENLKKIRQFYETWLPYIMGSPSATRLPVLKTKSLSNTFDVETAHNFLSISFTHHMEIINKTDTIEERLFYIKQAAKYKWDKYRLRDLLKQDLYHHQSLMPNNFLTTMPKRVQALKAIEMFNDEYLLDYINVEELGVRDEAEARAPSTPTMSRQAASATATAHASNVAIDASRTGYSRLHKSHPKGWLLVYEHLLIALQIVLSTICGTIFVVENCVNLLF